jgi:hypothetical protein
MWATSFRFIPSLQTHIIDCHGSHFVMRQLIHFEVVIMDVCLSHLMRRTPGCPVHGVPSDTTIVAVSRVRLGCILSDGPSASMTHLDCLRQVPFRFLHGQIVRHQHAWYCFECRMIAMEYMRRCPFGIAACLLSKDSQYFKHAS